jgi:flagellar basal body-associated protein FliL
MEEQKINPTSQKGAGTTVLVLIIVLLLISNLVTAYFLLQGEEEVEEIDNDTTFEQEIDPSVQEQETEEEMSIPELQTANIGEAVNLGDYSVTVLQIEDPVDEGSVNIPVTDGNKYVAIEILLENNTNSTAYYYTDWTLYDGDGYDYSTYSRKEPRFVESGSIPVNGTTRGWLNFRTIEEATDFTINFNDSQTGNSVEFSEN